MKAKLIKKKKITFIILIIVFSIISCSSNKKVENVTVTELEEIIKRDSTIQILDVRTEVEQRHGTILNAKRVNLLSSDFLTESISVLDKSEPVYVYCRSGRRSKVACNVLVDKGYKVINIEGGFKAWQEIKD